MHASGRAPLVLSSRAVSQETSSLLLSFTASCHAYFISSFNDLSQGFSKKVLPLKKMKIRMLLFVPCERPVGGVLGSFDDGFP